MGRHYVLAKEITVLLLLFIAFIFILIHAQNFLAPLCLAALLSYLLYPAASFLERHGLPRILANLLTIIFSLLLLGVTIHFFLNQFSVFIEEFPEMKEQAIQNLRGVQQWIADTFDVSNGRIKVWVDDRIEDLTYMEGALKQIFKTTTNTILWVGLMPVYVFFMLYYRDKFYRFILSMAPDKEKQRTENIVGEMNLVTTKYMTGVFTVVLILAVLHSVALGLIGLRYPVLLGVTAALFNFIPYFGTLVGAAVPLLYALTVMDSLDYASWVVVYFLFIQFTENNILTPNITGGYVNLNPFVTILSLVAGSMVWGVAGMFIVIPFVAMFRILCAHVSYLKPLAQLLSDSGTEAHALTWQKIKAVFKKD